MKIEAKIKELGFTLPPAPASVGLYENYVLTGNLLHLSGGIPTDSSENLLTSQMLIDIFGDKGRHSRTALGAAALPLNVQVEINMIVEISA